MTKIKVEYREEKNIEWMYPFFFMFMVSAIIVTGDWFKYMILTASYMIIYLFTQFRFVKDNKEVKNDKQIRDC